MTICIVKVGFRPCLTVPLLSLGCDFRVNGRCILCWRQAFALAFSRRSFDLFDDVQMLICERSYFLPDVDDDEKIDRETEGFLGCVKPKLMALFSSRYTAFEMTQR